MAPYGACEVEQSKSEAVLLNEEKGFLASKVSLDCFLGSVQPSQIELPGDSGAAHSSVFEHQEAQMQQIAMFLSVKCPRCSQ